MRISERIYIVGSGDAGIGISHALDCTVYFIDGGSECALIDAGAGIDTKTILANICADGFSPEQIGKILLTHAHADHAGGASAMSEACAAQVYALAPANTFVQNADLKALSLEEAIKAGIYGENYRFQACPTQALHDGDRIAVGDISVTVHKAEGHCDGHCCYTMQEQGDTVLFAGDSVFCGGKIALQAIWDCDLQKYTETIRRLARLHPDKLLPSHGCFALHRGYIHTDHAVECLNALMLPKSTIGE